MKNKMAMDILRRMRREGLDPTPEDVVRLNAFGLRVDEAQGKRADRSAVLLPRVAVLIHPDTKERFFLRQPTIGHEIWLKSVMRFADENDLDTMLAVNVFALSRPAKDLPDDCDPDAVKNAVESFLKSFSPFTKEVVLAATYYARFGIDEAMCEEGPKDEHEKNEEEEDILPDSCVAVASLVNGVSYLWGLSIEDMKSLTREQMDAALRAAIRAHGLETSKDAENEALDEFNRVADEIRERLAKEKESKNG